MTQHPDPSGRPLPAAVALGFAGAALSCLLLRELLLLACGDLAALGAALALLPLSVAAGAGLCRRLGRDRDPADLLAPLLGVLAVSLPLALVLLRGTRAVAAPAVGTAVSWLAVLVPGLAAFLPFGLCLGLGLSLVAALTGRAPAKVATRLPLALAGAGCLGALFVQFVAIPKLSPMNACLDLGLGCVVAGLVCAAGAPGGRGMETRLSLLALAFVLPLPVSGLIDAHLEALAWSCPVADIPTSLEQARLLAPQVRSLPPSLPALAMALAATTLLAVATTLQGGAKRRPGPALSRDAARAAAAGMAAAAVLVGMFFAYELFAQALYRNLPALAAVFLAGWTLFLIPRQGRAPRFPAPCPPALVGAALGSLLPAVLYALLS